MEILTCRRLRTALIFGTLFLSHQCAMACKCAPTRPACEVLGDSSSVVFVGTVTDTGPTITALQVELKRKFSQQEIERLENSGDLSLAEAKKMWARLLPKEAQPRLNRTRNEEQLRQLAIKYFPVLEQWEHPVRFAVSETFKGDHMPISEIWTGQGFGDCGFQFELNGRYLVYASRDEETHRYQTSTCTRTREYSDATADIDYLQSVRKGNAQSTVFGIVTVEADEFRTRSLSWSDAPAKHPAVAVQISIKSEAEARDTQTDLMGRFAFGDLRGGRYVMTAAAVGFSFAGLPRTVEVKAAGCSANVILAEPVVPPERRQ